MSHFAFGFSHRSICEGDNRVPLGRWATVHHFLVLANGCCTVVSCLSTRAMFGSNHSPFELCFNGFNWLSQVQPSTEVKQLSQDSLSEYNKHASAGAIRTIYSPWGSTAICGCLYIDAESMYAIAQRLRFISCSDLHQRARFCNERDMQ